MELQSECDQLQEHITALQQVDTLPSKGYRNYQLSDQGFPKLHGRNKPFLCSNLGCGPQYNCV